MLNWSRFGDDQWTADDDRFLYRITVLGEGIAYQGRIHRRSRAEQVFTDRYVDLDAAKVDLERRGRREYFVKPNDPEFRTPEPRLPGDGIVVRSTEPVEAQPSIMVDNDFDKIVPTAVEPPADDPPAEPEHTVEIYADGRGELRWRRKAANHKVISDSAEGYRAEKDLMHGLRLANQDSNYTIKDLRESQ